MNDRSKFIFELSQKILGSILAGALSGESLLTEEAAAKLAIKAAAALFDQLSNDGHLVV
jgi:hypothetical protein